MQARQCHGMTDYKRRYKILHATQLSCMRRNTQPGDNASRAHVPRLASWISVNRARFTINLFAQPGAGFNKKKYDNN
eukprot:1764488-Prymnesium_polylepis.1